MKELLNLFYRQDMELILCGAFVCAVCFRQVWLRAGTRIWFRAACVLAMAFWCYVLALLTLLNRSPGSESRYFLMPLNYVWELYLTGNEEVSHSMFMNAALFFPAGLLLSALADRALPRRRVVWSICLLLAGASLAVECCQLLLEIGRFEIDDTLFNSLGAYMGTLVLWPETPK